MFRITSRGSFKSTEAFLKKMSENDPRALLARYGQRGVDALASATPVRTGETAQGWYYEVYKKNKTYSIVWRNRHMAGDTPVAILIQYGHGTGTGGYVQGRDFINPAIRPVFDEIAMDIWKAVTSA